MNSFELTKISGAVLLTALAAMVISTVGNGLVHPKQHTAAVAEGGGGARPAAPAKKEEAPIEPVTPLLASASVENGEKVAKKCATCHDFTKGGKAKVGPPLWGIVGADKAHTAGFSYSKAMSEKEGSWTFENLNQFLANPRAYVPGTKMAYAGDKKVQERADLIVYLRSLADSPVPLP